MQILLKCPTPAIDFVTATKPSRFAPFCQGSQSLAPATQNHTAKSGLRCFVHFDLEMCFAPHEPTLFRHLNFQKWSENGALWRFAHFDLEMCFVPKRRANFSSLFWADGSAPAALASLLFDPLIYIYVCVCVMYCI